ncbi:unnamed protein product [Calypogeia fissa]
MASLEKGAFGGSELRFWDCLDRAVLEIVGENVLVTVFFGEKLKNGGKQLEKEEAIGRIGGLGNEVSVVVLLEKSRGIQENGGCGDEERFGASNEIYWEGFKANLLRGNDGRRRKLRKTDSGILTERAMEERSCVMEAR